MGPRAMPRRTGLSSETKIQIAETQKCLTPQSLRASSVCVPLEYPTSLVLKSLGEDGQGEAVGVMGKELGTCTPGLD